MRLLQGNSEGGFNLIEHTGDDIPEYAILSHTWGADTEEVTFQDLKNRTGWDKAGYEKICFCGDQAKRDGIQHFWVDTCCIDKSNSTELAEAINSMFCWYRNAAKCYVFLSDVATNDIDQSWQSAFRDSRWFTRGWTLPELIAPPSVDFFCSNRKLLGDKKSLERQVHEITGIAIPALRGTSLSTFSVKERMSWAENRETKREEDKAYSLLGIFDIQITFIYSEGAENAFDRLREKLYKREKKRQLDELSIVSEAAFNSTKRLKTARSESSTVPVHRDLKSLNPDQALDSDYSVLSIDATTKQSLMEQLYFAKIDERLISLTAAQGSTCRWFLTKPEYTSWNDVVQQPVHGGFLWIKGNPGTGKSTLMKVLFEEAKLNAKDDPSKITLSFFFLARGTVEERSTIGLYRSLLHQLFEKAVELKDSFEWMTVDGARVIQRNGWHEQALKQTLTHAVRKLESRTLAIFVDALDECDQNQAAGMVCFFEELCELARAVEVRLQICFSSRHYPTVVIQKGIEVILEDEIGHTEDIKQYIKSKLRLGRSKPAESLRSEILERSSRIFLWVVLVLDILNSEYPCASISIKKIRERLKEIPPELMDLFELILTRDGKNGKQLQVCLNLILFAIQPLKPQELYFAIQLGLDKECSSFWDEEDVELEQMKTFVRSSSKGFAEVTRNKACEVQFIHESVRDYLLGNYRGQWSGVSGNLVGHGHESLRNCCLAQINALISQHVDIPKPLPKASEAAQLRTTLSLKFPFLRYSLLNVLCHANDAQRNGIEQGDFLAEFPLQQWILLNNTLERHDIRRYTESVSIIYLLAEKNLVDLIRIHPQRQTCFDVEKERYGPPIFAALARGSYEAAQAFLEVQAEIMPQELSLRQLCKQYSENRKTYSKVGVEFFFSQRSVVALHAVQQGDDIMLTFLDALGKLDVEWKDRFDRTLLSHAAGKGHEAIAKLLLEKGAAIETKDNDSTWTPLFWAVKHGHEAVVKLLLEKGATIERKDIFGQTSLFLAISEGYEVVVKLLLEEGADFETKDKSGRTPLSLAAEEGQEAIVELLLEMGACVEPKNNIYTQTPLCWAARHGNEAVVKLLLEKGATVEREGFFCETSLSSAARNGHEGVVKLLLEWGADLEIKTDYYGQTPLSLAVKEGHEAVVKLLLGQGADLETKSNDFGQTPLLIAVKEGHEAVVKLLLEHGADLETKSNDFGQTPLLIAVKEGHEAVVKLLLEQGADLETKDQNGRTPLQIAENRSCGDIFYLLMEKMLSDLL